MIKKKTSESRWAHYTHTHTTHTMSLIIASRNVVLPAHNEAQPATVHVDLASGKISCVHLQHSTSKADCPVCPDADADANDATFIDYGDLYILPGLVESVLPYSYSYLYLQPTSIAFVAPMFTSTSLGAPIGRVSQQEPRQLPLEALPSSLTCPSILFLPLPPFQTSKRNDKPHRANVGPMSASGEA